MNQIIDEIVVNLKKNNYQKALELMNSYLKIDGVGIYDKFLDKYIYCLIKLDLIDEALKNIEKMIELFPDYFDDSFLAFNYIKCGCYEKAESILKHADLTDKQYFKTAHTYMLYGQIDLAKKYYSKCLEITDDSELKRNSKEKIDRLTLCVQRNLFIQQSYNYFKRNNGVLKPGYVIYSNYIDFDFQIGDYKFSKRPYMIFKIEEEKIYAFPLTTKINRDWQFNHTSYIIYSQNYLNFDGDRRLKDWVTCINENTIHSVYEIISNYDYNNLMKNMYYIMIRNKVDNNGYNQIFMENYINNLNIHSDDILIVYDKENRKIEFYYLVVDNNTSYYGLPVKKEGQSYIIMSTIPILIEKNKSIRDVIKLTEEEKLEIKKQLPDDFQILSTAGNEEKKMVLKNKENKI